MFFLNRKRRLQIVAQNTEEFSGHRQKRGFVEKMEEKHLIKCFSSQMWNGFAIGGTPLFLQLRSIGIQRITSFVLDDLKSQELLDRCESRWGSCINSNAPTRFCFLERKGQCAQQLFHLDNSGRSLIVNQHGNTKVSL